jgi:hypothetical protein
MDHNTLIFAALANVPTMITVLIGILINNARITDINSRMTSMENRFGSMDSRFTSIENRLTSLENKFDTRFDLLLSKVFEIDNRLIRLEAHGRS